MFYTIYKTTNILNGKFYIGKHQTLDPNDDYLGSGKHLRRAIKKYGIQNFKKEVLHVFDNEADMNVKEKEVVILSNESYNLCEGGNGGFGYINRTMPIGKKILGGRNSIKKVHSIIAEKRLMDSDYDNEFVLARQDRLITARSKIVENGFKNKQHTTKWKKTHSDVMKEKTKGPLNSQYGTCWITNGSSNKKIKKEELDNWVQLGYTRGRIKIYELV